MKLPKDKANILIANPAWNEVEAREWKAHAIYTVKTLDMLIYYDPEFAGRVMEPWHTISCDVEVGAYTVVDEFRTKIGPAVIPAHTMLAEVFSILEGSGHFKFIAPYYHFMIPPDTRPDTVRQAVYRLLDSADADEICHPEKVISCTLSQHLPREIRLLEKAGDSFIYRAPSSVISPLEM